MNDEKANKASAWIMLLCLANYQSGEYRYRGKIIKYKAGTITVGVRNIGNYLQWSPGRVQNYLKELEFDGMIERIRICEAVGPVHIIIKNWKTFQYLKPSMNPPMKPQMKPLSTTTKKYKEVKEPVLLERKEKKVAKFNFRKSMIELGFNETLVDEHVKIRRSKKAPLSEIAFNGLIKQINKSKREKNWILKTMCEKGWRSYQDSWVNIEIRNKLTF